MIDERTGFVVYDEHCRLCTALMHFVLAHQRRQNLVFVPVGSWIGSRLLGSAGMTPNNYDSIVYAASKRTYLRSEAIIRVLVSMGLPWRMAQVFLLIPERWRDRAYSAIARNRYQWFPAHSGCACAELRRPKQFTGHHSI